MNSVENPPIFKSKDYGGRVYILHNSITPEKRFPGDKITPEAEYDISLDGKVLARVWLGGAYPGRFHCSINPLRWSGPIDTNFHNHIFHDIGPHDTIEGIFEAFVYRAEKIFEWRRQNA